MAREVRTRVNPSLRLRARMTDRAGEPLEVDERDAGVFRAGGPEASRRDRLPAVGVLPEMTAPAGEARRRSCRPSRRPRPRSRGRWRGRDRSCGSRRTSARPPCGRRRPRSTGPRPSARPEWQARQRSSAGRSLRSKK
ncbi:MAG: hypothetical protein MZV64_33880 [Ignavibacteriales bacterium]|nr:hypothetical protein [Ignavibacteriales bacterium]